MQFYEISNLRIFKNIEFTSLIIFSVANSVEKLASHTRNQWNVTHIKSRCQNIE